MNEPGSTQMLSSVARIAAQRAAARELKRSPARNGRPALIAYVDGSQVYRYCNDAYEHWFDLPTASIVGRSVRDLIGESAYARVAPYIQRALRGELVQFEDSLAYQRGGARQVRIELAPHATEQGVVGYHVLVSDISGEKRAERALAIRARQQAVVAALGQRALAGAELQTLFDDAARGVAAGLEVELCNVLELLPGGAELLLRAGVGWRDGLVGHARVSMALNSQAAYTLKTRGPVIVEDLPSEARFVGTPLLDEHGAVSGLDCVIADAGGRAYGVLGGQTRERRSFSEDDVNFVMSVAHVLGCAIERHRAEQALREREERFRRVADHAPVLIWISDASRRCTWFNRPWLEFTGRSMADELGRGWMSGVHAEDLPRFRRRRDAAFKARKPFEAEYRLRRRDGEYRWMLDHGVPQFVGDEFVGFVGSSIDITERRRANDITRLLADAGAVLGESLDPEVALAAVADLVVPALADWCTVDLPGEGVMRLAALAHSCPERARLARELRARFPLRLDGDAPVVQALRSKQPRLFESIDDSLLRGVAQDEDHLRLLRDLGLCSALLVPLIARGHTLGVLTLVSAESGRRYRPSDLPLVEELARRCAQALDNARLYQDVRRSDERLRFTLEAARIGTWMWDLRGGAVHWSDNLGEIHGRPRGALPSNIDDARRDVHPEDRATVERAVARAIESGADYQVEYRVALPDGRLRWIEDVGRVAYDKHKRPVTLSGISRDITERKRTAQRLESEVALRQTIERAVPEGIAVLDDRGAHAYVNPAFCRMVGWSERELRAAQPPFVYWPPDERPKIQAALELIQRGAAPAEGFELAFQRRDGTRFDALVRVSRVDSPGLIAGWLMSVTDVSRSKAVERQARDHVRLLGTLNRVNLSLAAKLDRESLAQAITDAGRELTGAAFAAFFQNVTDRLGERYTLYTLSGAPREAFARFPLPRKTALFGPTFRGEHIVRIDDVTGDPRFGRSPPYHGLPEGHLPVRSYLAAPVVSRSGDVLGGLFFGHPEPGVFDERAERLIAGIAAQAAIALDNARLFEDRATLAAIVECSQDGIIGKTLDGTIVSWNDAAAQIYGYSAAEAVGQHISLVIPEDKRSELEQIMRQIRRGESVQPLETVRMDKHGRRMSVMLSISPIIDHSGKLIGASAIARDITDRKRWEERQQLLLAELSHRVKNTLATVQATAYQTMRHCDSLEQFGRSFEGRLRSLAATHGLLTRSQWSGAAVHDLLEAELAHRVGTRDALRLSGPRLVLRPKAALAMQMVLHELATNAAKYGALSRVRGTIEVCWGIRVIHGRQHFELCWTESGGPRVKPPVSRGFGTEVLETTVEYELEGATALVYRPEGLQCRLSFPWTDEAGSGAQPGGAGVGSEGAGGGG